MSGSIGLEQMESFENSFLFKWNAPVSRRRGNYIEDIT